MSEKILCIDTTADALSVAIWHEGVAYEHFELGPRRQAERILPMLDGLLAEFKVSVHHLDALAVIAGPGSFTGVRLSVSVAQALAFAANIPVIPISALEALAEQARRIHGAQYVLSAIDARMDEVYMGYYEVLEAGPKPLIPPCVQKPETIAEIQQSGLIGVGSGYLKHQAALNHRAPTEHVEPYWHPRAKDGLTMAVRAFHAGHVLTPAQLEPIYLRNQVASPPKT